MTGCTPMEYLLRLRIERAKSLLRETDMKIIDIAMACGIGSSQYFANIFRQSTGVTPSSYRRHVSSLSKTEADEWRQVPFRSEAEERSRIEAFSRERQ
jgi:transcriptional regulator GlxA family with amidase domain